MDKIYGYHYKLQLDHDNDTDPWDIILNVF